MKKKLLSLFTCLALCLSLLPTAAFADESGGAPVQETAAEISEPDSNSVPETIEDELSTEEPESSDTDPIYTVDADVQAVQAMIDALPDVETAAEEELTAAYNAAQAAYDAFEALTAQQMEVIDLTRLSALLDWHNGQVDDLLLEPTVKLYYVSTAEELKTALTNNDGRIFVEADITYSDPIQTNQNLTIKAGATLKWMDADGTLSASPLEIVSGATLHVYSNGSGAIQQSVQGTVINNGTIKTERQYWGACEWTATTTNNGTFTASDYTYFNYGNVPQNVNGGKINVTAVLGTTPTVTLPEGKLVGETITPTITGLISGCESDLSTIFNFQWKNGSNNKFNGETAVTPTNGLSQLKLTISPKGNYVIRTGVNTKTGSIDSNVVRVFDPISTAYVSATGNDNYAGDNQNYPLKTLEAAMKRLQNGGTIVLLSDITMTSAAISGTNVDSWNLNLNGHNLTASSVIQVNVNLTVTGNGNVSTIRFNNGGTLYGGTYANISVPSGALSSLLATGYHYYGADGKADEAQSSLSAVTVEKRYNVFVAGKQISTTNQHDVLGDGTVSYDPATQTLTLNNANVDNDETGCGIWAGIDLAITGSGSVRGSHGILVSDASLILNGDFTSIEGTKYHGICAGTNLTINANIASVTTQQNATVKSMNGDVAINGDVKVDGTIQLGDTSKKLTIGENATVTVSTWITAETTEVKGTLKAPRGFHKEKCSGGTLYIGTKGYTWNTSENAYFCMAHDWEYTAVGATLTAKCSGCPEPNQTLTISASGGMYSSQPYGAELSATTIGNVTELTIQYQKKIGESWTDLTSAPVDAGEYKASVAVNGTTAFVEYSISKATPDAPAVNKTDETISGWNNGSITGLTTAMEWRKENETSYTAVLGNKLANLAAGKYYVRYKGDDNHNPSPDAEVEIEPGPELAVTAPTANSLTYSGHRQNLVEAGHTTVGTMQYSLSETGNYGVDIPTGKDAGDYTVWYRVVGADGSTIISGPHSIQVTIEEKMLKITVLDKSVYVGSDAPDLSGAEAGKDYTIDGLINGETVSVTLSYAEGLNTSEAGEYEIKASVTGDYVKNYNVTVVSGKLTVSYRPSSGSSSTYPIIIPSQIENGSVSTSTKYASKGTTVVITVAPDAGYELGILTVTDKNGKDIELTDKGECKYTFKMPAGKVTVQTVFVPADAGFADVPDDAYYAEAVNWAAANGITGGIGSGLFAPDLACTRAQIVTFLWRAAGSPEPTITENPFTDVDPNAYYYKAVLWAVENGITKGTGGTTFSPDLTCTRAQAVSFIYRNEQAQGGGFTDLWAYRLPLTDVPEWCYEAVAWCYMKGITGGIGGDQFGPDYECTRAQIVTFLYRASQAE